MTHLVRATASAFRLSAFCFVGGFIDIVGFISVIGVFVAHVTSNVALAGSAFVAPSRQYTEKLLVLPVFVLAIALATLLNDWARRRRFNPERLLLGLECLLLIAFMFAGAALQRAYARLTARSSRPV